MNIDYLKEFVVFSHYMSFSTAAKKLFVSQPTLSSHIRTLEKELGVSLIDRKTSRLTRAGRVLVNGSADLFQTYDSLIEAVKRAPDEDIELSVAFDSPNTDAASNWSILLQRFLSEHPLFSYNAVKPSHSSAREVLAEGGVDCVIVFDYPVRADMAAGVAYARIPNYMNGRISLWMSEKHPLARLEELHWADLSGIKHPFAASLHRLWATSIKEALDIHGISYQSRLIGGDGGNHFLDMRDDEVQLYDTGYARNPSIAHYPGRILKPIADDDAESFAYVAYLPGNENPALRQLLRYIEDSNLAHNA